MASGREVVVLSGVRTAIGDYGGGLKDLAPTELSAQVIREAVKRAKVDAKEVGACVIGNVIHPAVVQGKSRGGESPSRDWRLADPFPSVLPDERSSRHRLKLLNVARARDDRRELVDIHVDDIHRHQG